MQQPDLFQERENLRKADNVDQYVILSRLPVGDILKVSEVATALNWSSQHVREMCECGVFRSIPSTEKKDGRIHYNIVRTSVEAYIKKYL